MKASTYTHSKRSLKALFLLAGVICLIAGAGGGLLLALAYPHPELTRPLWQFGQYAMLLGLVNFAIYVGIYWQVKRLLGNPDTSLTVQPVE